MRIFLMVLLLLTSLKIYSCPITITNDTDQRIIIVDPRGREALLLDQNKTGVIDPTIFPPLLRYILNEKLDFYYRDRDHFYKKYRLTEKYCTDDPKESELTISQIINFVQKPTDRFKVKEFSSTKRDHIHNHQ